MPTLFLGNNTRGSGQPFTLVADGRIQLHDRKEQMAVRLSSFTVAGGPGLTLWDTSQFGVVRATLYLDQRRDSAPTLSLRDRDRQVVWEAP
jgi:hypothetical protein